MFRQEALESRQGPRSGACDNCRKRKAKCDMSKPYCGVCVSHGWQCSYSLLRRRPGPRKGFRQANALDMRCRLGEHSSCKSCANISNVTSDRLEEILNPGMMLEDRQSLQGNSDPLAENPRLELERPFSPLPESVEELTEPFYESTAMREQIYTETEFTYSSSDVQSILDAFKWTSYAEAPESRLKILPDSAIKQPNPVQSSSSISSDLRLHLLSLYFTHVTLSVPVICKAKFYQEYEAGRVPTYLCNAMFALSSRFSNAAEVLKLANGDPSLAGQHFSCQAGQQMSQTIRLNRSISIDEVKAAYLLAFYHSTCAPSSEAGEHCSKAVRMAYVCGLHQIDNLSLLDSGIRPSQLEMEEMRCIWWAIYIMDNVTSLVCFTPSNIEDLSMATCLPVIVISEMTAGTLPIGKRRSLGEKVDQSWYAVQDVDSLRACLQTTLVLSTSLVREISRLRRLCRESLGQTFDDRLADIQQKWESLLMALPSWFFLTARHELEKTAEDHWQRLEVLTTIYITGAISCFPPLELSLRCPLGARQDASTIEGKWELCISHILNIAASYREWPTQYVVKADPLMCPLAWTAGSLLSLQLMNAGLANASEKLALLDALDAIMRYLKQRSRYWGLARSLLCSLEDLRGRTWMKLDVNAIFQLASRAYTPLAQMRETNIMATVSSGDISEYPTSMEVEEGSQSWRFPLFSADPELAWSMNDLENGLTLDM